MKIGQSYDSVVLGVSEQVPQDRRSGQHAEQVNFISDPVRGLARRWGSVWKDEFTLSTTPALLAEFARMREFSFIIDSVEYSLLYRSDTTSQAIGPGSRSSFMFLYNKTTDKFLPVNLYSDAFVDQLVTGGVSALTSVGRYLYIAGNDNIPTYTQENEWTGGGNDQRFVAWVRAGAYSRTYAVKMTRTDGSVVTASYKTKPSAYPEIHDTSGIPLDPDNPSEYQKAINDANNLYNSKVTAYIGEAAADITPENIAQKLAESLNSQGVPCFVVNSTVCITATGFADISSDDGGDGSTLVTVGNEINAVEKLSLIHLVGKVVRVRPRGAQAKESFYMKAYPKSDVGTGWQEVIWREAPGVKQTPQNIFCVAAINAGALYVAPNPAVLNSWIGTTSPINAPSEVGDGASAPVPNFYGKRITMLSVFQDRLVVGSEGVVSMSRPGDYLNFFRQTVLDVRDNDPLEMYAYGAEGDVLRSTVLFDRDLVIFGDQKQYAVSGRTVLSPKSPNISVMSAHEDSTQAHPTSSGNLVFYGKEREGRTSVHQLQIGQLTESPESVEITQQLDTYLKGKPVQLVALTSPNTLVFRTDTVSTALYVYNYIDTPAGNERLFDSWCTWRYPTAGGTIAGCTSFKGELLIFSIRFVGSQAYMVADKQSLSTDLSPRPHIDSLRKYPAATGWHAAVSSENLDVAIGNTHESFLFGDRLSNVARLIAQVPGSENHLWVGQSTECKVQPTNPYRRDNNGKAVVEGRLTLTQINPSFDNTAGMEFEVSTVNRTERKRVNVERVLGAKSNVVGQQPVVQGRAVCGVGHEVRECSYTIYGVTWMPITITALSWVGQYFNRIRRAG